MADIADIIRRVRELGSATIDSEEFAALAQLADECERLQAERKNLLRAWENGDDAPLAAAAKAECERLRERVRELEEALRPFAFAAGVFGDSQQVGVVMRDAPVTFHTTWRARAVNAPVLRGADFNAARSALAKGGE